MVASSVSSKTQQGTKWSVLTEVGVKLISPIVNMILARLLTPEAFGVVATVTMITSFADIFSDAGFQKFLIQHDFKNKDDFFKSTTVAFWTNLGISLVIWLIIFIFSDKLAELVGNAGLGRVVWVAALSLPLTSFSSIQMAHYRRNFRFNTLFKVRMIGAFVPLFVTVPIAFFSRSYWALIIGTIIGNLVNAIILTVWSEWKPTFYYSLSRLKQMFAYSWWILFESIIVWLTSYVGTFIVSIYLSQTEVGFYKTGMSTVNQIISLITAATSAPLFSALSALKDDDKSFVEIYVRYIRAISIFVIPLGVGVFLFQDLITDVLLGSQWTQISGFIGLWGLVSSLCLVWGTYCNGVYNAKGKPYLSVLSQVLHLIVLIPVIIIGCHISFSALCTMRSLARLEMVIVQMFIMGIAMKISPWRYMSSSMPSIICSIIMAIVGTLCIKLSTSFIWQIISVMICIIVYFVVLYIFYRETLKDALKAFGIKLPIKMTKEKKND